MAPLMAVILRESGVSSNAEARGIADGLVPGIRAPRGDTRHPTAVVRLLNRLNNTTKAN